MDRNQRVLDNLQLVDHVLQKNMHISRYSPAYEDYQQEGRLGLIAAADKFDESRGFQFSTLAAAYIEGYIRRYNREYMHNFIKVPRRTLDNTYKIFKLSAEGCEKEEICKKLDITEEEYIEASINSTISSLSTPISSSDTSTLYLQDILGSEDPDIVDLLGEDRVLQVIEEVANEYNTPKQKSVWYEYIYPAYYGEKVRQQYIAEKYHISQAQICRILNKGKRRLMEVLERV